MHYCYARNEEIVFSEDEEATQLFHPTTGDFFVIGGIGRLIWQRLELPSDVDHLVAAVTAAFDEDVEIVRRDITEFLAVLLERGLVGRYVANPA